MPKGSKLEREKREQAIMDIINQGEIKSQEAIVTELEKRGIYTTQATVSRYLNDKKLAKNDEGRYVLTEDLEREDRKNKIRNDLREHAAGGLTPVKIMMITSKKNRAAALAAAVEDCEEPGILGTIVDGDKVLILFCANIQGETSIRVICEYLGLDNQVSEYET